MKTETYHVILNPIDRRIQEADLGAVRSDLAGRNLMVAHAVDLEHANFLERPLGDLLRKVSVGSLAGLPFDSLHACIEPLVCQHLQRTEDSEACGVPRLHGGDQSDLFTSRKGVFNSLRLFLRVIAVCRRFRAQNRREQRACVPQGLADCLRNCDHSISAEEAFHIRS